MFRIVIVEDEISVRRGLVMGVDWHELDCQVIGDAENGEEGLQIIKKLKPDIVISDIQMPKMTGITMMSFVLKKQTAVFIVLSAYNEFAYVQDALKLGAVDYLLKPFKDEELITAINRAKQKVERHQVFEQKQQFTKAEMITTIDRYLSKSKNSKHRNIIKILSFIHENYDKEINLNETAFQMEVSESYLSRLFREETSYSFHEYLTIYRIKIACEMLKDPNIKIYEVALATGYREQRYFSIVFKKYMGVTPGHYKEQFLQ
ncbi:MAG: response regulator [Breznakia sp.]